MQLRFFGFCSLFLLLACSSPNKVALDIAPDHKTNYVSRVTMEQDISVAGNNMKQSIFFEYSLNFHEISGSDNLLLKLEYEKIRLKNSNPMLMMDYDSETYDPADTMGSFNFMGAAMHKLLNRPIDITLTSKGKIMDVKGFEIIMDDVVENMLKQFGGITEVTPEIRTEIRGKMNDLISDENLKSSLQQIFIELPEEKVAKDDVWSGERTAKMSGISLVTKDQYKVSEVRERTVLLDVNSTVKMDAGQSVPGLNLDGTQTGTMELDKFTGLVLKADITQNLKGTASEDTTMQMDITSKISAETEEVK